MHGLIPDTCAVIFVLNFSGAQRASLSATNTSFIYSVPYYEAQIAEQPALQLRPGTEPFLPSGPTQKL